MSLIESFSGLSDVAPAVVRIQCKSGEMVEIQRFFMQMDILFFPSLLNPFLLIAMKFLANIFTSVNCYS